MQASADTPETSASRHMSTLQTGVQPAEGEDAAFVAIKSQLVDKYRKMRDRMNRKGVFDAHTNNTRAETLLQAELLEVEHERQLAQLRRQAQGKKQRDDDDSGSTSIHAMQSTLRATPSGVAQARSGTPANATQALNARLDTLRESLVEEPERVANERRRQAALATQQQQQQPPAAAPRNQRMARRASMGPGAQQPIGPRRRTSMARVSAGPVGDPRRASGSQSVLSGRSNSVADDKGESPALTAVPHGNEPSVAEVAPKATVKVMGSPSPQVSPQMYPAPDSPTSPMLSSSPAPILASPEISRTAPGVAGWLQRSAEHSTYPNAEKELRGHLKRRDEPKRDENPVNRYGTPWLSRDTTERKRHDEAAALTMDELFEPTTLMKHVRHHDEEAKEMRLAKEERQREAAEASSPYGTVPRGAGRGNTGGSRDDFTVMAADHGSFIKNARHTLEKRKVYRGAVREELQSGAGPMHESLHPGPTPDVGDPLHYAADSSDEDGEPGLGDPRSGTGHAVLGVMSPLRGGPIKAQETTEAENACDVVECAIVCLCEHFIKHPRAGPTRDIAVLRNVALHSLHTLEPAVKREIAAKEEERRAAAAAKSGDQGQSTTKVNTHEIKRREDRGLLPELLAHRVLRSWTKGVECILMLELQVTQEPFSVLHERHLEALVTFYSSMKIKSEERAADLMKRWKKAKETLESAVLHNDDITKGLRGNPDAPKAAGLVDYFNNVASVSTEDLAKLDLGEANVAYRQRQLAQSFLNRFTKHLPGFKPKEGEEDSGDGLVTEGDAPVAPNRDDVGDSMQRPSSLKLRHVLLRYAGLLAGREDDGNTFTAPSQPGPSDDEIPARAPKRAIGNFLNVFKGTWGRTPLAADISEEEANTRAAVLDATTLLRLIDTYVMLLNPTMQSKFAYRVKAAKDEAESTAKRLVVDASVFVSPDANSAEVAQRAVEEEALKDVERRHLIDKYTRNVDDVDTAERLRKAIESSDEWYGYEAQRRNIHKAVKNELSSPAPKESDEGDMAAERSLNGSQIGGNDGVGPDTDAKQTRMEVLRIRKLQELEACWQSLSVSYMERIALHDKWNDTAKDVKAIDAALKLYKRCIRAVKEREASVKAVLDNERNPNLKEKTVQRHVLFNEMCAAGQKVEVAAKLLLLETGDELHWKSTTYTLKMKDDFIMVSKLLRSPV